MELFCEEVKCRVPVCSTCYIEHHLGHKASLISNKVGIHASKRNLCLSEIQAVKTGHFLQDIQSCPDLVHVHLPLFCDSAQSLVCLPTLHQTITLILQVQDAKQYLNSELQHSQMLLEKLQEYSDSVKKTIDQIDTAYEQVFQRINSKEKLLCDKVRTSLLP